MSGHFRAGAGFGKKPDHSRDQDIFIIAHQCGIGIEERGVFARVGADHRHATFEISKNLAKGLAAHKGRVGQKRRQAEGDILEALQIVAIGHGRPPLDPEAGSREAMGEVGGVALAPIVKAQRHTGHRLCHPHHDARHKGRLVRIIHGPGLRPCDGQSAHLLARRLGGQ
nr:hypothetical protein [Kangsaoukella pontilimi]